MYVFFSSVFFNLWYKLAQPSMLAGFLDRLMGASENT